MFVELNADDEDDDGTIFIYKLFSKLFCVKIGFQIKPKKKAKTEIHFEPVSYINKFHGHGITLKICIIKCDCLRKYECMRVK